MAGVLGLHAFRVDTVVVPGAPNTFNHLVLTFEDGKEVHVPITKGTADEIKAAQQAQESLRCKTNQLSLRCVGCALCDPAQSP